MRKQQCTSTIWIYSVYRFLVPGLLTGSSSSLPQDTTEDSSSSPFTTRCQSASTPPLGNQFATNYMNQKHKKKTPTGTGRLVARFARVVEGTSQKCRHHGDTHPQALLVMQVRNLQEKRYRGSTVTLLTSRKTPNCEVAKRTKIIRAHW